MNGNRTPNKTVRTVSLALRGDDEAEHQIEAHAIGRRKGKHDAYAAPLGHIGREAQIVQQIHAARVARRVEEGVARTILERIETGLADECEYRVVRQNISQQQGISQHNPTP